MDKKQKIKIISSQYAEDDKETIIAHTEAVVSGESDDYKITYIETQGDSVGEETSIHVRNGRKVSISRNASSLASLIIIEKGIRHITHYSNSGLSFNMGISCSELISDFENGRLYFRYETDMELVPIGEIEFEFIFRKTEDL